ncbi:unnamed protein product [Fusarium venenatum]|uniref:Uncharacterized protein n=1 Tax=Fusarium venenatum TaxID=56646 RepID=A0A2L2SPJ4_9HYPO|nr:uncharacterized protein FVRRES_11122 [Fusarium venenatum]CEI38431.1 unnamed protein product [Fusarium venenatum]
MIIYAASMVDAENDVGIRQQLIDNITSNMKVTQALTRRLVRFGFHELNGEVGGVSGPSEAFYLSELSPFRRAYDDTRASLAGSLGSSSYDITQDVSSVDWNQHVNQLLDSSIVSAAAAPVDDHVSSMGDYTQAMFNVSQEITWDLFSLPDWVFQQEDIYFGA